MALSISIIHPSRSRPKQAKSVAQKWIANSGLPYVDYILSVDSDDEKLFDYNLLGLNNPQGNTRIEINKNRSAIDAINIAAKRSYGDILIVLSDDFDCPNNWGAKIIEATKNKKDWIAKTPDGIQKWIITMPILDREYYNRFGYIYYPEYKHMFCDTEITCVADLTGRKIALDIPFTHNHYSIGKSAKDEVSIKADSTWAQGEKLFIERYKKNFDLVGNHGKITNNEYLNWIKGKL